MNQEKINKIKQEINQYKHLMDKQRAEHVKYYINYVRENYGEKGVEKVMDTIEKMGFDIDDPKQHRDTEWVPESWAHIFFITAARIFDWYNREIYNIGRYIMPRSIITRVFLKYFSAAEKTLKKGVEQWNNNFTRGKLEVKDIDKKKRKGKFVLKNFKNNPMAYVHFQGFFSRLLETITGSDKVKVEDPVCLDEENGEWEWKFHW